MDNIAGNNAAAYKYEDQIKLRKAKLEKIRKEKELLQLEKLKRANSKQENLEEIRYRKEIREKAAKINDSEIHDIQQEINAYNQDKIIGQCSKLNHKTNECQTRSAKEVLNLKFSTLTIMEIPPVETTKYSKHTQTDISRMLYIQDIELKNYEDDEHDMEYQDDDLLPLKLVCNFSSNLPPGILSPGLPKVTDIPPASTTIDKENPWKYLKGKIKQIAKNGCEEMISTKTFQQSLKRVSQSMENVLSRNKNICVDYIDGVGDWINDNHTKASINLSHVFRNENLTKSRCITCIDWSPHSAEQLAVAYHKKRESTIDVGEDVLIWNQNSRNQMPERIFNCQSSVMSLYFAKFNPNLILGATYSGQIVMWDCRVNSYMPVQYTKLNCKAHTQPIYCLREIGCVSSHNLISISSDGKLCSWNLDMFSNPTDVMQLQLNISEKVKKPIAVSCMDFPSNGANNLVFGGEDGCAYSAFRYGYEAGINNRYGQHEAPITAISSHYNKPEADFGNLFLTSSFDCTIKLWSLENSKPLHNFKNNYDYVMDVAWSPVHPAVFITADGSGYLDLYDLNENSQEPIESINTSEGSAINRLAWNKTGQHVALGTEYGELYLCKIREDLANPGSEEWSFFERTLRNITANYGIEFND